MEQKMITIPFEVEKAKKIQAGEEPGKIVTREGCDVRIVCWDVKYNDFPIVAALTSLGDKNKELVLLFKEDGRSCHDENFKEDRFDLLIQVPEWTTYKDGDILIDTMNMPFIYNGKRNKERGHFGCYCAIHIDAGIVFEKDGNDNWTDCIKGYANEEDRQKLIDALEESYHSLAKEYLKRFFPNHSNYSNIGKDKFEPGQPVIGIDGRGEWRYDLFSHYKPELKIGNYVCSGRSYNKCLPYNEKTKHLLGTTKDWEE